MDCELTLLPRDSCLASACSPARVSSHVLTETGTISKRASKKHKFTLILKKKKNSDVTRHYRAYL